jgi:hypothetical protein
MRAGQETIVPPDRRAYLPEFLIEPVSVAPAGCLGVE